MEVFCFMLCRGTQKNGIYLLKLCIYSGIFKLQSPSECSPFDAIHLLRLSSTSQNSSELIDFDAF